MVLLELAALALENIPAKTTGLPKLYGELILQFLITL